MRRVMYRTKRCSSAGLVSLLIVSYFTKFSLRLRPGATIIDGGREGEGEGVEFCLGIYIYFTMEIESFIFSPKAKPCRI